MDVQLYVYDLSQVGFCETAAMAHTIRLKKVQTDVIRVLHVACRDNSLESK